MQDSILLVHLLQFAFEALLDLVDPSHVSLWTFCRSGLAEMLHSKHMTKKQPQHVKTKSNRSDTCFKRRPTIRIIERLSSLMIYGREGWNICLKLVRGGHDRCSRSLGLVNIPGSALHTLFFTNADPPSWPTLPTGHLSFGQLPVQTHLEGLMSNRWRLAWDAVNACPEATSARTDDADRMA